MLQEITYYPIFGKPLIMYLGIITLLCFLVTATIAVLTIKGVRKYPLKWHTNMAKLSILFAIIHAVLGTLLYF